MDDGYQFLIATVLPLFTQVQCSPLGKAIWKLRNEANEGEFLVDISQI